MAKKAERESALQVLARVTYQVAIGRLDAASVIAALAPLVGVKGGGTAEAAPGPSGDDTGAEDEGEAATAPHAALLPPATGSAGGSGGLVLHSAPLGAPVGGKRRPDEMGPTVLRIFRLWQDRCDHAGARLTPERSRVIKARLRDGYTEADLAAAVEGCAMDPFYMGENERQTRYNDLTLILRNGSHVEKFREKAGGASERSLGVGSLKKQVGRETKIEAMRANLELARKKGDQVEYERCNRELRELLQSGDA